MKLSCPKQKGFALLMTIIILIVLSILVVNAIRNATLNEKMAGNYMDRSQAQQAAEQALRQAQTLLVTNGETCLSGCSVAAGVVAASASGGAIPTAWSDTGKTTATLATNQKTSAWYQINQLNIALPTDKTGCVGYSIMGRGQGADSRTSVVLQTIAYVCSAA